MDHKTADGYPVEEGGPYWDNGLHLVTVTKVASFSETNRNSSHPDFGKATWWHETTGGLADGSRLARFHPFTREDAWEGKGEDPVRTFTVTVYDGNGTQIWSADTEVDLSALPKLGDLGYNRKAAAHEAVIKVREWLDQD